MPLIIAIVLLTLLRYLEIGPFAALSWWWIAGLFAFVFLWFEFFEKMLGLDKRRAHNLSEKTRQNRVKKTFK